MGLGGVLHQPQAVLPAQGEDAVHVEGAAVEVDAEDAHGPRGDPGRGVRRIEVQGLRIDVGEDDLAAQQDHGLGGGEEAEGGDDHLVPRLETQGAQAEDQRVGAVGEADAGLDAEVSGAGRFELLHLGAEDEGGLVEDLPPALVELRSDAPPGTAEVEDGDVHGGADSIPSGRRG